MNYVEVFTRRFMKYERTLSFVVEDNAPMQANVLDINCVDEEV